MHQNRVYAGIGRQYLEKISRGGIAFKDALHIFHYSLKHGSFSSPAKLSSIGEDNEFQGQRYVKCP